MLLLSCVFRRLVLVMDQGMWSIYVTLECGLRMHVCSVLSILEAASRLSNLVKFFRLVLRPREQPVVRVVSVNMVVMVSRQCGLIDIGVFSKSMGSS